MTAARAVAPLPLPAGSSRPAAFRARITTYSDGSFELAPDGSEATLIPVALHDGTVVDFVAFFAADPRRWWTEKLAATHLGDAELNRAQWFGQPINLVPTPALWLTAPEQSMCILDWRADIRAILGDVADIVCSSHELKNFLDRRLCEQVAHRYRISVAK
jgi:hypothetical protein